MRLPTASYAEQSKTWPSSGNHILAQWDQETIVVYQAYSAVIADFALQHGRFGDGFSYQRMSWIKPNFLWMMYRSEWGQSKGQERILAIRLKRSVFDSLLDEAIPSSFNWPFIGTEQEWKLASRCSNVLIQWDPDHLPTGEKCERRAIQIGLRRDALENYGKSQIVEIIDMSEFVAEQRAKAACWQNGELYTPTELEYLPASLVTAQRVGLKTDSE
jgi:hypothetical protein